MEQNNSTNQTGENLLEVKNLKKVYNSDKVITLDELSGLLE